MSGSNMMYSPPMSHGERPPKSSRKRKGADEYAAEHDQDFTCRSTIRGGQPVRILVCRYCCQAIGARSDRIREHLSSKRHQKLKLEAINESQESGWALPWERDAIDNNVSPEPPRGKSYDEIGHLLEVEFEEAESEEGRHQQRELTSSPVEEAVMKSSPSTESVPPVEMHQKQASPSPSPPTSQQLFSIKWDKFSSNMATMFSKLRTLKKFADVTLWCDGKAIPCHKIILSACSPYFEKLLEEVPAPHLVICLKDMRSWEVEALVEFMYRGEVRVHQDQLQDLIKAAESLKIKGLDASINEDSSTNEMNKHNSKDASGSNNNSNHSPRHPRQRLGGSTNNFNHNHGAQRQRSGLSTSTPPIRMNLSNHGTTGTSVGPPPPPSGNGSQGSSCTGQASASKRRRKIASNGIDPPRRTAAAGLPEPVFNLTMGSEIKIKENEEEEEEGQGITFKEALIASITNRFHVNEKKNQDQNYDGGDFFQLENHEEYDPFRFGNDLEHDMEMDEVRNRRSLI